MVRTKNKQFNFYVSEKDYKEINKKIEKSKLKKQEYLTKCALEKEINVIENMEDLKQIFVELKKQGSNLNQITRKINRDELVNLKKELGEFSETWQLLKQLIQKVL